MAKFEYHLRSTHINPGVTMTDLSPVAQSDIVRFMSDNYLDSPDYRLKKESGAFLQGHDAQSGWMFVEFWSDPEKHQATVDRLLEIFLQHHPDGWVAREELNTLPGNDNPGLVEQLRLAAINTPESESLARELEEARAAQAYVYPSIWGPLMERVRKCLFLSALTKDSSVEKTIEITITGPAGVGKSRITAMIHEMLEREFQNLKIEVNDHDGPKTYAMIKERLEEMKRYPLHPDAAVRISNYIRPQSLTDAIRESTEIATLNPIEPTNRSSLDAGTIDGVTPVPGDRVHLVRLSYGAAANDDQENPE